MFRRLIVVTLMAALLGGCARGGNAGSTAASPIADATANAAAAAPAPADTGAAATTAATAGAADAAGSSAPEPVLTPPPHDNLLSIASGAIPRVQPLKPASDQISIVNGQNWKSESGDKGPFTFVYELPGLSTIDAFDLQNTDATGTTVHVVVSVSTTSAHDGFSDVATIDVPKSDSQPAHVAAKLSSPAKARWVRATVTAAAGAEQTAFGPLAASGKRDAADDAAAYNGAYLYRDLGAAIGKQGPDGTILDEKLASAKSDALPYYLVVVRQGNDVSAVDCAEGSDDAESMVRGTVAGGILAGNQGGASHDRPFSGAANADGSIIAMQVDGNAVIAYKADRPIRCSPPPAGSGPRHVLVLRAKGDKGYGPPTRDDLKKQFTFDNEPIELLSDGMLATTEMTVLAGVCNASDELAAFQKKLLLDWVSAGYKLIIEDADSCHKTDYAFLPYNFKSDNPGAAGASSKRLIRVESNDIGSGPNDPAHFLDVASWAGNNNEIGDANTVVSQDPHWCGHLFGTNVNNVNGFMQMYAPLDKGLIIYTGFDGDEGGNVYHDRTETLGLQLTLPANLPCTQHVADAFLVEPAQTKPFAPGTASQAKFPLEALANQGWKGTLKFTVQAPSGIAWPAHAEPATLQLNGGTAQLAVLVDVPKDAPGGTYAFTLTATSDQNKVVTVPLTLTGQAPGSLRVRSAQSAPSLEVVLDLSGSMLDPVQGTPKYLLARGVMRDLVHKLPPKTNFALRIFSAHKGGTASCSDSELTVPLGPLNPAMVVERVNALKPRGETPLVRNMLLAAGDLAKSGVGSIVVVTDGAESCGGDITSLAHALQSSPAKLAASIVGFDISDKKTRDAWTRVSTSTGGQYYDAHSGKALAAALQQAIAKAYTVYDAGGNLVGRGEVDGPKISVPGGTYTVVVASAPVASLKNIVVSGGKQRDLSLQRTGNTLTLH